MTSASGMPVNSQDDPRGVLGYYYRRITDDATALNNALNFGWKPRSWFDVSAEAGINLIQRVDELFQPRDGLRPVREITGGLLDTSLVLRSAEGRTIETTANLRGTVDVPLRLGFRFRFTTGVNYRSSSITDVANAVLSSGAQDNATFGWYVAPSMGNSRFSVAIECAVTGAMRVGATATPVPNVIRRVCCAQSAMMT